MERSGTHRLCVLRAALSRHCQQTHAEDGIQTRRRTGSAQARLSRPFPQGAFKGGAWMQAWSSRWCKKCVQRAWEWGTATSERRGRNSITLPMRSHRSLPRDAERRAERVTCVTRRKSPRFLKSVRASGGPRPRRSDAGDRSRQLKRCCRSQRRHGRRPSCPRSWTCEDPRRAF